MYFCDDSLLFGSIASFVLLEKICFLSHVCLYFKYRDDKSELVTLYLVNKITPKTVNLVIDTISYGL